MVGKHLASPRSAGADLTIVFHFEGSMTAAAFGKLFSALSKDYRAITRRELVVRRIEMGSLHAVLTDAAAIVAPQVENAVELIKATKAIFRFCKALKDVYDQLKQGPAKNARGVKSVEAIMEAAITSNSEVELTYNSPTEQIRFRSTPVEAVKIRERAKVKISTPPVPETTKSLPESRTVNVVQWKGLPPGSPSELLNVRAIASGLAGRLEREGLGPTESEGIATALLAALRAAGATIPPEALAEELATHNLGELATAVRRIAASKEQGERT